MASARRNIRIVRKYLVERLRNLRRRRILEVDEMDWETSAQWGVLAVERLVPSAQATPDGEEKEAALQRAGSWKLETLG